MKTLDIFGDSSYMKKRFTVRQAQDEINRLRRSWQLHREEHWQRLSHRSALAVSINTPIWRGNAINRGIVQMRKVRELARKHGTASRAEV